MAGRGARSTRAVPRRVPGQHLLRSAALAAAIVREADVRGDDLVVEIGAGNGRLTAPLAERAASVQAIELDPRYADRLRGRFRALSAVTVVEGDALLVPLPRTPFRVVGSLPFHLTTALLRRLLDDASLPIVRADVIVEWDLACKRARCWPSTQLGVVWGARHELAVVRRLQSACFEPSPSVDAAVLRIVRRREPLVAASDAEEFERFVRTGFGDGNAGLARRLGAWASPLRLKRLARELGFGPAARARDLDVHQWAALFAALHPRDSLGSRTTRSL